jgi:putative cardiolipin synthase
MLALAVIGGCASIPDDYDKQESYALTDTSETTLGRQVTELSDPHPGKSGFQLMQDGSDALAARLLLADRAEASIAPSITILPVIRSANCSWAG